MKAGGRLGNRGPSSASKNINQNESDINGGGGGGGGPTTKKIVPPGKPKMSFVFFVLFQNTFKIDVFVANLVKNVSSKKKKKKIMIFFLFFFGLFAGFR